MCVVPAHAASFFFKPFFKGVPKGKEFGCALPASCKDLFHMVSIAGSMREVSLHCTSEALTLHIIARACGCEYNALTAGL